MGRHSIGYQPEDGALDEGTAEQGAGQPDQGFAQDFAQYFGYRVGEGRAGTTDGSIAPPGDPIDPGVPGAPDAPSAPPTPDSPTYPDNPNPDNPNYPNNPSYPDNPSYPEPGPSSPEITPSEPPPFAPDEAGDGSMPGQPWHSAGEQVL